MIFSRHTDEDLKYHRGKESVESGEFDSSWVKTYKLFGIPIIRQSYRRNVDSNRIGEDKIGF